MRPKPRQPQILFIELLIDQQQIRLDVTLAETAPITNKFVIAVTRLKRLIVHQCC